MCDGDNYIEIKLSDLELFSKIRSYNIMINYDTALGQVVWDKNHRLEFG